MTTITYRDGIMAADTRAYSGSSSPIGQKRKIFRLKDGSVVGCSTTKPGVSEAFINWLEAGSDPKDSESIGETISLQAILVRPNGEVFYFSDSILPSGPIFGEFFAIGSGDQYAIGALACGATAEAAVLAASHFDQWTNSEIQTLPLNEPPVDLEDVEVINVPVEIVKSKKRAK